MKRKKKQMSTSTSLDLNETESGRGRGEGGRAGSFLSLSRKKKYAGFLWSQRSPVAGKINVRRKKDPKGQ